jgi:ATP-dependent DNA helicase RecQ
LSGTAIQTLKMFRSGASPEAISSQRGLVAGTIYGHLATALEAGEAVDVDRLFNAGEKQEIASAFARFGFGNLTGVHQALGGRFNFGALRLFRAALGRKSQEPPG